LLSLPDQKQRLRMLEQFTLKVFEKELEDKKKREMYEEAAKADDSKRAFFEDISKKRDDKAGKKFEKINFKAAMEGKHIPGEGRKNILKETVFFGWGDLKNLVESKTVIEHGMDINSLADALAEARGKVESAVSLDAYGSRFADARNPYPIEEFFLLIYLVGECNEKFSPSDRRAINCVLSRIREDQGDDFELVKQKHIKEEAVSKIVRELWDASFVGRKRVEGEDGKMKNPPNGS
jgi:hypothetical protein